MIETYILLGATCPKCGASKKTTARDEKIGALGGWQITYECHPGVESVLSEASMLVFEKRPEVS